MSDRDAGQPSAIPASRIKPTGSAALDQLIATVSVVETSPDHYRGPGSTDDGVDATFGGHFLAQAISASLATVEPERRLHSIHATFLRPGQPGQPFELAVERIRDGRSFCTRRVRTNQEGGKPQFELTASCTVDDTGPEHLRPPSFDWGSLPDPESRPPFRELMAGLDPLPLPREWALRDYGLDIRTINAPWVEPGLSSDGGIRLWVRADGSIPADDHHLQAALLAYHSDESLADTVPAQWGATWGQPGVVFVSLDHAIWFHRQVDLNQWLLFDQRPLTASGGRGLATTSVWNQRRQLVATINQEILIRLDDGFLDGPK